MALTKNDLIDQVSTELGFLRNQSHEVTESLIEIVKSSLASGDDVLVSGFGKFCVKYKSERKGRGKLDKTNRCLLPVKHVFLYPLHPNFRQTLTAD